MGALHGVDGLPESMRRQVRHPALKRGLLPVGPIAAQLPPAAGEACRKACTVMKCRTWSRGGTIRPSILRPVLLAAARRGEQACSLGAEAQAVGTLTCLVADSNPHWQMLGWQFKEGDKHGIPRPPELSPSRIPWLVEQLMAAGGADDDTEAADEL